MNPSLDDLKRLEKESQHLYDNAHDDMSDYFKDVLELIFTHERLIQSHEQLQKKFEEAVEVLNKIKDGGVPPMVLANVTGRMLAMCGLAEEFLASLDKER